MRLITMRSARLPALPGGAPPHPLMRVAAATMCGGDACADDVVDVTDSEARVVAAQWSRPSPWSLPFEEVSSGLTGGEVLLRSSALKRSVGAASVLLWSASGGPVSGPSRACEGVTVAGGGVRLPLRAH